MEQVGLIKVWKLWGWIPQNWNLDSGDGEPAWLLSLRKQDKERLVRWGHEKLQNRISYSCQGWDWLEKEANRKERVLSLSNNPWSPSGSSSYWQSLTESCVAKKKWGVQRLSPSVTKQRGRVGLKMKAVPMEFHWINISQWNHSLANKTWFSGFCC